jgi:hypothetical protein
MHTFPPKSEKWSYSDGEQELVIPTYTPRWFGRLDTWRFSDWAIKVYGISTEARDQKLVIDQGLVKEAHSFVAANLARMEETSHYSVGFVIHASWKRCKIASDSMVDK